MTDPASRERTAVKADDCPLIRKLRKLVLEFQIGRPLRESNDGNVARIGRRMRILNGIQAAVVTTDSSDSVH